MSPIPPPTRHARFLRLLGVATSLAPVAVGCGRDAGASGPAPSAAPSPAHAAEARSASTLASARPAASAEAAAASRPAKPLNVILITVDSLRADMPWAGYERKIAPNLTRFAEESIQYTHAYSGSSYTAKSVATMLSGRFASTLFRSGWFFANYAKANEFFTEPLQAKGIRTIGGHAHLYFGRGKGLEQGFDVWELVPGITFDPQTDPYVTSDKMTAMAQTLLGKQENTGGQFFAWFHYMDPHDKYQRHPECPDFGSKNRDVYDNEVCYTDLHLGKLLTWIDQQPWSKTTAVMISADHGEAFGEHGATRHAFDVWEVLTHVPWLVKLPGVAARKIDGRRSHIDLAPTIVDLMGQPPLASFEGASLVPELYGGKVERPLVMTELAEDSHNPQVRAIIAGDWKLTVYGNGERYRLYDLQHDPKEDKDLVKSEPAKLAEMKKLYDEALAKMEVVEPYGGMKLKSGREAKGPLGRDGKK